MFHTIPLRAQRALPFMVVLNFAVFPLSNALVNLTMLLTCVLWIVSGQYAQRWNTIRRNVGLWCALGLYLWMWIGITYSPAEADDIQQHLGKYFKLAFMALVVTGLPDAHWRRRAWWAFAAAMAFVLVNTYLNIWFQLPWSRTQNQGWNVDHTVVKDYISQGMQMSLFVALMLAAAIRPGESWRRRLIWITVALAAIVSITHLSAGRSAYLALVATLAGFGFWAASRWTTRLGAIALVVVATAALYTLSPQMQSRVQQTIHEVTHRSPTDYTSAGQRLYFAEKSLELIREKPLLGWGTGAYHDQYCRIADTAEWCRLGSVHPHNQFLFIAVDHGLVGLMLMLMLVMAPLWVTRHAPAHERGVAAAFSGIFVVVSLTHGSLWLSTESHFSTFMAALIFSGGKYNANS